MRLMVSTGTALLALAVSQPSLARPTGTIEGVTTTLGGLPLNGMCGKLYDLKATTELIDFAGTGTDGMAGHYIQTDVPPGHYKLLFVNCGANTNGTGPDFNYTPIFYGSTWNSAKALRVDVTANVTTMLGTQGVPDGGSVIGFVKDKTIKMGADSVPVLFVPPDGGKFFLNFSWTLVCADANGNYNTNSSFQQGVPNGSTIYFAPNGWGCTDSHGVFNDGKWIQSKSKPVSLSPEQMITVNGTVTESATASHVSRVSHGLAR